MSFEIIKIIGPDVEALRDVVAPRIQDALQHAHGEVTAKGLIDQIALCRAQLWLVCKELDRSLCAVAVTEVKAYEGLSSLLIVALSGAGIDHWARALYDALEAYCNMQHLERMEAVGRKGFERKLGPLGFSPAYTVFVREVELNGKVSGNN